MKVKDIIEHLEKQYEPDENLLIFWWNRYIFTDPTQRDEYNIPMPVTAEVWAKAIQHLDGDMWAPIMPTMYRAIDEAIAHAAG